jgi:crossover junction endodeoxyribonuclease RuvC
VTLYLGVDPGLSGALAFLDTEKGHLHVLDMPVLEVSRNGKKKREVSAPLLANILNAVDGTDVVAVVERVSAMPGQGVTSMFSFGRSLGIIEGALAACQISITFVSPQVWQKAAGVRGGKDGSRQRACELFPNYAKMFERKKDDGRADAALMAWYAATK